MSKILDFQDYFSLDDLKTLTYKINLIDTSQEKSKENSAKVKEKRLSSEGYQQILQEDFYPKVEKFLLDANAINPFKRIKFSEGHDNHFINAWNSFTEQKEGSQLPIRSIVHSLLFHSTYYKEGDIISLDGIQEKYQKVIDKMNSGNFGLGELHMDCTCNLCGNTFQVQIEKWQVVLYSYDKTLGKYGDYLPKPTACLDNNVSTLKINFKTKDLLISDWFRIQEFTDYIKKHEQQYELNHAVGIKKRTESYINDFNMVCIFVGNTSPKIMANSEGLAVGYIDEETLKKKHSKSLCMLGSVCTDLWAVSIIEKEELIKIISLSTSREKAEQIFADYLKNTYDQITEVEVVPGEFTLKYHHCYQDFQLQNHEPSPVDCHNMEPFFILEGAINLSSNLSSPKKKMKNKI